MLSESPVVSKVDLQGSRAFLAKLGIGSEATTGGRTRRSAGSGGIGGLKEVERALEGGAG